MKKIFYISITILLLFSATGCESFFNPDSDLTLSEKDYVGDYTELYSGFMGIAGAVRNVSDKSIYLEGLRGDFLEPTENATREVWDIYNYADNLQGNTLANPKDYYNVILNCNDYIDHVFKYKEKNPTSLTTENYNGLIGGALRFKAWAYLMLAKIYGEAIYFDEPLTQYQDVSKFPKLSYDEIIEKCRLLIEVGTNNVNGKGMIRWSVQLFPGQADSPENLEWNRICPTPESLLAEIYLNQNNYQKAWENCVSLIRQGGDEASFQLNLSEYNGEWIKFFAESYARKEEVTVAFFDYTLNQENQILNYFSNTQPNSYIMRPSQVAMNKFNNQLTSGGLVGDKYRGNNITFKFLNNNWVFYKYIAAYETTNSAYKTVKQISLCRASQIHLFLVESLIGLGRFEEALAFLNDGVGAYYNSVQGKFLPPFDQYPSSLYVTSSTGDKANRGIRGRVDLSKAGESVIKNPNSDINVDKRYLDSLVVVESTLGLAGESSGYYAMIRNSKRWGSSMQKSWANKIAAKYKDGSAIKGKLESDISNWFIKYDLK